MKNAFGRPTTLRRPEQPSIGAVPGAGPGEGASIRAAQLRNRSIEDPEARIEADRAAVAQANKATGPSERPGGRGTGPGGG
jgi:hypothetical protein